MTDSILILNYIMILLWLSYLPLLAINFKNLFHNRSRFVASHLTRVKNDVHIIFQITTRSASRSGVVERGIWSIKDSCRQVGYSNYSIEVVSDDKDDMMLGPNYYVVPSSFSPFNGAVRKARALQYAVERRRKECKNTKKYWVFHMDEESVVLPQTILALLQFIREGKGLISEGPIFYPIKFEYANRLAALSESIRPFQCYDCASQMTDPPPVHMHGSNLLVRADIEDGVGWDFSDTLAEDQLFGVRAYQRYGNIFGWHGGILLEQPPLTLRDHFRQRRRWIIGTMQNFGFLPVSMRLKIIGRLATYLLGFFSATATLALYIYYAFPYVAQQFYYLLGMHYTPPPDDSLPIATLSSLWFALTHLMTFKMTWSMIVSGLLGAILLATSLAWFASYQIGLYWNLKYSNIAAGKKFIYHLQQLIASPIIGVIETLPGIASVLRYYVKGKEGLEFQVIAK